MKLPGSGKTATINVHQQKKDNDGTQGRLVMTPLYSSLTIQPMTKMIFDVPLITLLKEDQIDIL